jgi:cellulose synthase (UDP-forming)
VGYLLFDWLPVRAFSATFFWHLVPYLLVNELLFLVISWGRPTWRGRQYNLALFPLWIAAVVTAAGNVFFGKHLDFAVTPKTRQSGVSWRLVRWQLAMMALLIVAMLYGLARLALGHASDGPAILINVFWGCYDVLLLSVVVGAVRYQPQGAEAGLAAMTTASETTADLHGRALGGAR